MNKKLKKAMQSNLVPLDEWLKTQPGSTRRGVKRGKFKIPGYVMLPNGLTMPVMEEAREIVESHDKGREMDAGFDAGGFSGPAHSRTEEKALRKLASRHEVKFQDLMDYVQERRFA